MEAIPVSTLAIVFLSILAGLFLALILAAASTLIFLSYKLRSLVSQLESAMHAQTKLSSDELATLHKSITGAFVEHRNELSISLTNLTNAMSQIDSSALSLSVKQNLTAARRIEQAALAIGELSKVLVADQTAGSPSELGAEEYAQPEPGERFIGRSRIAGMDAEALAEEAGEATEA